MGSCLFYIFNHVKTRGLSRLKSHNFVIFQDNKAIFRIYMSVWRDNILAEFHQKILNGRLKIWKIRQGITFFAAPCRSASQGCLRPLRTTHKWHFSGGGAIFNTSRGNNGVMIESFLCSNLQNVLPVSTVVIIRSSCRFPSSLQSMAEMTSANRAQDYCFFNWLEPHSRPMDLLAGDT